MNDKAKRIEYLSNKIAKLLEDEKATYEEAMNAAKAFTITMFFSLEVPYEGFEDFIDHMKETYENTLKKKDAKE